MQDTLSNAICSSTHTSWGSLIIPGWQHRVAFNTSILSTQKFPIVINARPILFQNSVLLYASDIQCMRFQASKGTCCPGHSGLWCGCPHVMVPDFKAFVTKLDVPAHWDNCTIKQSIQVLTSEATVSTNRLDHWVFWWGYVAKDCLTQTYAKIALDKRAV
jgi:hypothetical protein